MIIINKSNSYLYILTFINKFIGNAQNLPQAGNFSNEDHISIGNTKKGEFCF